MSDSEKLAPGDWVVTVGSIAAEHDPRERASTDSAYGAVLDLWEEATGAPMTLRSPKEYSFGPAGDDENAIECAYRLWAAVEAVGRHRTWVRNVKVDDSMVTRLSDSATVMLPNRSGFASSVQLPAGVIGWGPLFGSAHHGETDAEDALADRYAELLTFQLHSGRALHRAGLGAGYDIIDAIADIVRRGDGRVFVKINRAKWGVESMRFTSDSTRHEIEKRWWGSDIFMGSMHLEGRDDAYLVQEHVDMTHEYRLFVVDGHVVTGAGAVEEFTPADNAGSPFDTRTRRRRGADDPVARTPQIVDQLVEFGSSIAREIADEKPALSAYSLDVALDEAGRPLVVELNGVRNSGFYASRPELICQALAQRA